jgi:hypothetical protein
MSNNPRHLRPRLTRIDGVIGYFAQKRKREKKEVYALQIGANDGITDDPIHYYVKRRAGRPCWWSRNPKYLIMISR